MIEDPYQRPELQFFPLRKGPQAAGEVIATFELIELDYSGHLEVRYPGLTGRLYSILITRPSYLWVSQGLVSCRREWWLQVSPGLTSLDTPTPGLLMDIPKVHLVRSLPLENPYCCSSWGYPILNASDCHCTFHTHICICIWEVLPTNPALSGSPAFTETHGSPPSRGFPCFGVNSDLFFLVALSAQ